MPGLWAVVGATGTGKSELSLGLAERLSVTGRPAEVVNADAMQLYAGMDIGTAKLPLAERRGIPHHLLDVLEPSEEAAVAQYQQVAREAIEGILSRGADAILVGGSGLYVSSVVFDYRFPPRDAAVRASVEQELEAAGVEPLMARLRELAPDAAEAIDSRNPRRVVRALEVALLGGDPQVVLPADAVRWQPAQGSGAAKFVGIAAPRAELVARLDRRVERMWADGMLDEVAGLRERGIERGKTASRAIGYAQALAQLAGRANEADAVAETQALTRRYARRQVSWFTRYPEVQWLDRPDAGAIDLG